MTIARRIAPAVRLGALSFSISLASVSAFAQGMSDEEVQGLRDTISQRVSELRSEGVTVNAEVFAEIVNEKLADVEVTALTLDQIDRLSQPLSFSDKREDVLAHLGTLAQENDVQGARAAVKALDMLPRGAGDDEARPILARALAHPALPEAISQDEALGIFNVIGQYGRPQLSAELIGNDADRLLAFIPDQPSAGVILRARSLLDLTGEFEGAEAKATRNTIRTTLLAAARKAVKDPEDDRTKGQLESAIAFLDGAYAKGELLNHPLPPLDILWSSNEAISSFKDLRGNILVLDFWATWCAPCIAAFPIVREEVEHYQGYPVKFIGVTSLQGRHYGVDRERTDTSDNPELEYELMAGLMPQHEITWDVVFTEQKVYNPDFGIQGIPFVAIVDPEGKVRKIGLNPLQNAEEIKSTIEGLLEEFDLPRPSDEG